MRAQFVRLGHVLPFAAVATSLFAAGCTDSVTPTDADTEAAMSAVSTRPTEAELKAFTGRGIDAEFSRLSRQIPGFGGMYFDRTGRLNVFVKAQGGAAITADVAGRLRSVGGAAVQTRLRRDPTIVTVAAAYDFNELQVWKARLSGIFGVRGVAFLDVDESQNRLRIGLTASGSQRAVEQALKRAGVPREAVIISPSSGIEKMKTLQDPFRRIPAGVQIVFPSGGGLFACTLGFNALLPGDSRNFFVTASHCSDVQGGNQRTPYHQPFPANSSNQIGVEFRDPNYGSASGNCVFYPGFRCRFSDALLARYRVGFAPQHGRIVRTEFARTRFGSLEIDTRNPRFRIIGEFEFPFLGETAHKIGRSTGWTRGNVVLTCVDTFVGGTDIVQICQDFVQAGVVGGDSGSTVFELGSDFGLGDDEVFLIGVLWGGGTLGGAPVFVLSSMENIEVELGPLTTEFGARVASAQ